MCNYYKLFLSLCVSLLLVQCEKVPNIELSTIIDSRDNIEYQTVKIGEQTWFAENLAYESVDSRFYNDQLSNISMYGRLYSIADALLSCPNGWHLSSDDNWVELESYLGLPESEFNKRMRGSDIDLADKLKSESALWQDTRWGAMTFDNTGTNLSGFNALPGGYLEYQKFVTYSEFISQSMGYNASFWASSDGDNSFSCFNRSISSGSYILREPVESDLFYYSVRCVKD